MKKSCTLLDLESQGLLLSNFDTYTLCMSINRFSYDFFIYEISSFNLGITYYSFTTFDTSSKRFYPCVKCFSLKEQVIDYINSLDFVNSKIPYIILLTSGV